MSADISELLSNDNASVSPSVNGARTTNNSFVFNGVDVTNLLCCNSRVSGSAGTVDNNGGSLSRNIAPAPETLQEVKLQTSLYDAATGRNGGGNFTLVSKSGTNEFRGTAYYYNQNDRLMANDFFFTASATNLSPRLIHTPRPSALASVSGTSTSSGPTTKRMSSAAGFTSWVSAHRLSIASLPGTG